jgi:hypothetical protein
VPALVRAILSGRALAIVAVTLTTRPTTSTPPMMLRRLRRRDISFLQSMGGVTAATFVET